MTSVVRGPRWTCAVWWSSFLGFHHTSSEGCCLNLATIYKASTGEHQHDQQEGAAALQAGLWDLLGELMADGECSTRVHCTQMNPPAWQLLKALPKLPQKKGRGHPKAVSKSLLQSLVLSPVLQAACNEHVNISATCSHFKGGAPNQLHLKKSSNFLNFLFFFFFLKIPCQVFWNESWGRPSGD